MSPISYKDLTKLIKLCKNQGASELEVGSIKIRFREGDTPIPAKTPENVPAPSQEELNAIQEHAALQENANQAEDEMAFMANENPVLFEQLLLERDLQNEDSPGEIGDDVGESEKT